MRFPWMQFENAALERAGALAQWLKEDEFRVHGMLMAAWRWGCTLGPKDGPPDGICIAPNASRRLAAEMRYEGDVVLLVEALDATGFLELREGGLRIRGMSRYRRTWAKNTHRWEQKLADAAQCGADAAQCGADAAQCGADAAQCGALDVELDVEKEVDEEEADLKRRGSGLAVAKAPAPLPVGDPVQQLRELWNKAADQHGLPRWIRTPADRRRAALERLKERALDGPEGWAEVLERMGASPFLLGQNTRGWKATPDWLLRPGRANRLLEGQYLGNGKDITRGYAEAHVWTPQDYDDFNALNATEGKS